MHLVIRFVVPVATVEEIVEIEPKQVIYATNTPGNSVGLIPRRGKAIPLVMLRDVFKMTSTGPSARAIVVRRAGRPVAFGVDRVLGQQEVVVRPMADELVRTPGVSGATDLGDGRPTLVLDLVALCAALGPLPEREAVSR
jgi:two-component system chemotaxis sensor kinase CheA